MSGGAHLTLHPDRCDQCGRCESACPEGAIKPGPSYIYVDWHACTGCNECVGACSRDALERSVVAARVSASRPGVALGDVSKVVVGSRAEAKALRKAAEQAAKSSGKTAKVVGPKVAKVAYAAEKSAAAAKPVRAAVGEDGGPPPGAAAWTAADAAVVLTVLLLTVLAKDAVLGLAAVGLMPPAARTVVRAVVLAMYYSLQIGAFAWLASRHGMGLLEAFALRRGATADDASAALAAPAETPSAIRSAGLVAIAFVGTETFSIVYGLTMQKIGWVQPARLSSDLSAVFGGGGVGMLLSVLLVALVAPFVEELAFRGVLLPVLGSRIRMWPAILGSAAVYAAYHLNAWLFAPTLVLGIALGWLAWTRRSLWPAIALHVLYNAAAVAAGFYVTR